MTRLLPAACGFEVVAKPVIVLVNCQIPEAKEQPQGVRVGSHRRVADWISSRPPALRSAEVETVFSAARCSTTSVNAAPTRPAPCDRLEEPKGQSPSPSTPTTGHGPGQVLAVGRRVVVTYSPAQGLRLHGDPRPHQRVVKEAGFRWDSRQGCWYVPGGGRLAAGVVEVLADQLGGWASRSKSQTVPAREQTLIGGQT